MNIKKGLLSLSLVTTLAISSFATTIPANTPEKKSATVTEIQKTIQNLNIDVEKIDVEQVKLKFMVTANNEIVVLDTDGSDIDARLKSALNYKSINSNDLTPYKVYILPISFQS